MSWFKVHMNFQGWMNEILMYDPDTYHISNTNSVFVTLDGSTLRLQTPLKWVNYNLLLFMEKKYWRVF